ncbi:hypothetical protein FOL46_003068 [Perkinsus olseni]|uniref:Uncharacterized protein n=1 Tax=Perkinsus olseni TaxID=32597 RepID=A0A7J6M4Q9_PEROL|nr:hypothetical protein FOL46_003068 [Perkinsus olseni]
MPLRSYEKHVQGPGGKRHRGYQFDAHPREFGPADPRKSASAEFNKYLDRHLENTLRSMYPRYFEQKRRENERSAAKARRIAALRRELEAQETALTPRSGSEVNSVPVPPSRVKVKLTGRVHHLHPFAYVNRHSRDISLVYPWKCVDEENQLKRRLKTKSC